MAVINDTLRDAIALYRDLVRVQAKYGSDQDLIDYLRCTGAMIKDLRNRVQVYEKWRNNNKCQQQSLNGSQ